MARRKSSGGGENEYHIVAVRMRVVGTGNFKLRLQDLDDIQTQNLTDIAMQSTTNIEPTRLANFQSQRTRFWGALEEIDEIATIQRIIIFAKAVAVEYPGGG